MLLIGASTFLVALLPTYAAVGVWAPILLVILRLIQGFAVGGEIAGASAMIIEHSPFGRRGYYGSFTLQGVQAGQILAAAVFLPLSAIMPKEAFESWGWRIPFLLSAVVVFAGYMIRKNVDETPAFQEEAEHGEVPQAPIVMAVKENGVGHVPRLLHGADERDPDRGDGVRRDIRHQRRLRRRFDHHQLPVDLGVRQRRRRHPDPVRRQPDRPDRPPPGDHRRLPGLRASWRTRTCTSSREANLRDGVPVRHPDVGRASTRATTRSSRPSSRSCSRPRPGSPRSRSRRTSAPWSPPSCRRSTPRWSARPRPPVSSTRSSRPTSAVNGETCRALGGFHRDRAWSWTVGSITLALAVIAAIAAFSCPGDVPGPHERPRQQERRPGAQGGVRPDPQDGCGHSGRLIRSS